ncbi:MAG TPA: hypothetical protein PLI09_29070, partial [Candidatus Hydrogenedentes bacterium]|nr:hypothetical protein [Candidatus Hydrogenedentota bacterium]
MRALIGCMVVLFFSVIVMAQEPVAVVMRGEAGEELAEALALQAKSAGYAVDQWGYAELCDPVKLNAGIVDLLILPEASILPIPAVGPLEDYLKGGGDLLALNTPLWQKQLIQDGTEWVERAGYQEKHAANLMQHVLFDFAPGSIAAWTRNTNDLAHPVTHTIETGLAGRINQALHVSIGLVDNWETFMSPPLEQPFLAEHTLTVFWAKGGPYTTELAIEWDEKDGSRWIGTVPLTPEWQQFVMEPKDFHFWESDPARANTEFQPQNAAKVSIGIAHSHLHLTGDKHEYWLGPFGTAERTPEHEKLFITFKSPRLDTLSPGYKFFPCQDVAGLVASGVNLSLPSDIRSSHPRAGAGGFDKGRVWSWRTLVEAESKDGMWRGAPGTLLVHSDGPYKGGVWASFSVKDETWYRQPETMKLLGQVMQRMHRGVFIVDGGANFYTYFPGQSITLGINIANVGKQAIRGVRASVNLEEGGGAGDLCQKQWDLDIAPGQAVRLTEEYTPGEVSEAPMEAVARLRVGDAEIDNAKHPVYVWAPKDKKSFITVERGDFMLDGKRWRAHGVNYMPSSGIGTEDGLYFERWMGARSYDPEIIRRDLLHVKDMGLNAVSVFLYRESMEAQNLLDLMRQLDELGVKANLSLRPGSPIGDFDWNILREMIEYYRLPERDCIFAYDMDWEPMFREHESRKRYDAAWRDWIEDRYGSVENAEKDWGFSVPRDEKGEVTNPLSKQTYEDGEWRGMVAAYRRFLDVLLYEKYGEVRRWCKEVDPNHMVSFRMAEAGNPTFRWDKALPFDFAYLAGAVDILEPEAYGRIGDWEKVKPGRFEYEYARWANPNLPVMWAEMGASVWVESRMTAPADRVAFQGEYFTHFYRMLNESGADGVFSWWYPGGYRVGECSDFGIIEPDGTDRAVTLVIREYAHEFLHGPDAKPVDQWIEVDRDAHPDGIGGIYEEVKEGYWKAVEEGKTPGLKTAATGSTSADCPLVAIGNVPCTGLNPPKYLDGYFDRIEVMGADGTWRPVERNARITVKQDAPVKARVTITNLNEARWLTPNQHQGPGGVYVVCSMTGPWS